jgi:hypothetical protein
MRFIVVLALVALSAPRLAQAVRAEEGYCANPDDPGCDLRGVKPTPQAEEKAAVKVAKGANDRGLPPAVSKSSCEDRNPQCVGFAAAGECNNNPGWMIVNCPSSCNACDLRDSKVRCNRNTLNISTSPTYAPGEMGAMFSR